MKQRLWQPNMRIMYIMLNKVVRCARSVIIPVGLLILIPPSHAQSVMPHTELQRRAETFVLNQFKESGKEISVVADPIDSRTSLPSCRQIEGFLSPGARLWGKVQIGLRCLGPEPWVIYVPVDVRITGFAVYPRHPIRRGEVIGSADVELRKTILTQYSSDIALDLDNVEGKTTQLDIPLGTPVRQAWLAETLLVRQGKRVRLISRGSGFVVSMEGVALEHGALGKVIRVRSSTGRIVQGIVQGPGLVEVSY
jgi:flagellar basal body P-ring formation protein FlgA